MNEVLGDLASLGTAVGVLVGVWQLRHSHIQKITEFEDSFAREYRELAGRLPTKALLGEELTQEEYLAAFDEFYHYFDLCNEQVFLRETRRITRKTWEFWRQGIEANLKRPAFRRAWREIAAKAGADFSELRFEFPPDTVNGQSGSNVTKHA